MARVNVYLPDELADRARAAGVSISRVIQGALGRALAVSTPTAGLIDSIGCRARMSPTSSSFAHLTMSATSSVPDAVVVDASARVAALLGTRVGVATRGRIRGCELHAPAHLDAEVLSALGRLYRAGEVDESVVSTALSELALAPIRRHHLTGLLAGAWAGTGSTPTGGRPLRRVSRALGAVLITTDGRLARGFPAADLVS